MKKVGKCGKKVLTRVGRCGILTKLSARAVSVNEETKNGSKEIEPGMTLRVAEQYEIKDVSGKIKIQVEPFNIWSDETLFEYEFNLD